MGEDAGKKDDIRNFLKRVNKGVNFIEEIWIEREVKQRGSEGKFNEAKSRSGRQISNITELLTDDLRYSFDGNFIFRFIAAAPGSGKTTLLDYLRELIEVDPKYRKHAIVVQFPFNELLSESGNESFGVKFYSYVLTRTFWELMRDTNTNLSNEIKEIAKKSLSRIIGDEEVAKLELKVNSEMDFTEQLGEYFAKKQSTNFKKRFFDTIKYFIQFDPQVTFVYLMDELDGLQTYQNYVQDARSIVRDLINEGLAGGKNIRLMIYMVGVSDDVETFIKADQALYSRVSDSVINLVAYRREECEQIRTKIEKLIEAVYIGCNDFDRAWKEIKDIQLEPAHDYGSLREFCKKFSEKVIEIHEKYFSHFDKSFNKFESRARQLVEIQAKNKWSEYLGDNLTKEVHKIEPNQSYLGHTTWEKYKGKGGYVILVAKTTTTIRGVKDHALDCYAELWHNNAPVAKAYGEAKHYPLTKEHIDTFYQWLNEFNWEPFPTGRNPSDLAFIISPYCTDLQKRKLKIKGIEFIEAERIDDLSPDFTKENGCGSSSPKPEGSVLQNGVSLNKAEKKEIILALKGTGIKEKFIEKLMNNRPYKDFNDLAYKIKPTTIQRSKLEMKLNSGEISFD